MRYVPRLMLILYFLAVALTGFAQVPITVTTVPDPASPMSQSLAVALGTVTPPAHRVYLTVAAEKVALSPDSVMPPGGSSLTTITDAYGRSVRAFGTVTAIAPPTMVILNPHPEMPDLYAGLASEQAFKLLAASLSNTQWQALTGERGLGLSDLRDEDQRRLFQAIFPDGSLKISASNRDPNKPNPESDLSEELPQVRLRLDQNVRITLPVKDQPNSSVGGASAPATYFWNRNFALMFDSPAGVPQSAEIPNVLKPGQLDWNLPALRVLVPITGLETVGDLVGRVAQMTHLEIYADPHYAGQSLTILGGDNVSAPAADLLRTVAFCVTGTFRQVGPAFVLTDDLVGVATRRKVLANFAQDVSLRLKKKLTEASDVLVTQHSPHDLSMFGDPLAPTSAQWKAIQRDANPDFPTLNTDLTMDQLTPAQQAAVQNEAQRLTQMGQQDPQMNISAPDLTGKMHLEVETRLELLVPSLDSPVETNFSLYDLFMASSNLQKARSKSGQAQKPPAVIGHPVTLPQAMILVAHRVVLIQPRDAADLDVSLATMKRFGFNQLWLEVFSGGQTHLMPSEGEGDLLSEAIRKTKGTGIQVYAVMDLFGWGTSAPPDAVDLTVLGETSVQDEARRQQAALAEADADGYTAPPASPATPLTVAPLAPAVQNRLVTLVRTLAQRPGLAGFVLRNTAPEGYNLGGDTMYSDTSSPLGYNEGVRLAFLRQQHADPIDVSEQIGSFTASVMVLNGGGIIFSGRSNRLSGSNFIALRPTGTTLPNFDDFAIDSALSQVWDKFRSQGDLSLMRALYSAASRPNSAQRPLIWVEQRRNSSEEDWFGLWNSPTALMPEWRMTTFSGGMNQIDRLAKSQSPLALLGMDTDDLHGYTGLAALIHHRLLHTTWDGFVLDMTLPKAPSLEALTAPVKPKSDAPEQKEGTPR